MKIELTLSDDIQLELAQRVRDTLYEIVRKEIPGTKPMDVITPQALMKLPTWGPFLAQRVAETWDDFLELYLARNMSLAPSELTQPFGAQLEQARAASNARRAAKNKSIKLSAKDHGAAKRLLREHGIDFE